MLDRIFRENCGTTVRKVSVGNAEKKILAEFLKATKSLEQYSEVPHEVYITPDAPPSGSLDPDIIYNIFVYLVGFPSISWESLLYCPIPPEYLCFCFLSFIRFFKIISRRISLRVNLRIFPEVRTSLWIR